MGTDRHLVSGHPRREFWGADVTEAIPLRARAAASVRAQRRSAI
jgi:hypothetical protein